MASPGFAWRTPPPVVGHRGSPVEAPENTLASFRAAFAAGARAVELDARLTKDHVLVVHHDAELGRTVVGQGLVEETLWADLSALDAGSWFGGRFADERVPTLAQVLDALPPDAMLDVELKPDAANATGLPAAVWRLLDAKGVADRALVTSFDPELADEYARLSGRPAGAIVPFAPEEHDLDAWPRLTYLALAWESIDEEVLALARRKGRTVLAWTVNRPANARELLRKGVASVITDRPADLHWAIASAR